MSRKEQADHDGRRFRAADHDDSPLGRSPGVFRVGNSRVLLELVLDAFKRGESPEAIVRSYRTLRLADVYAVISRYLANPASFDEYLRVVTRKPKRYAGSWRRRA